MEIMQADDSHLSEIVELWKEFMDFHQDLDPYFARSDEAHVNFEKHVKELMASEEAQVLVGRDKDKAVAFSLSKIQKRPPAYVHET